MKIIEKENLQKKLTVNLDRKQYFKFMKEVAKLGKELEYKSNINSKTNKKQLIRQGNWANLKRQKYFEKKNR
jgi:hypothetical protein